MLNFSKLSLADKEWIEPIVRAENSRSAAYCFGTIYIWDPMFQQYVARFEDRLILKYRFESKPFYAYPVGSGPLKPALLAMEEYAASAGFPFVLRCVTETQVQALENALPGYFSTEPDSDSDDYIYDAESLATLAGSRLHGKRNHINRFIASHSWHFEPLSREHIPACLTLLEDWIRHSAEDSGHEKQAILRAFDQWETLGQDGGVLFAEGQLVAFTFGERISDDTFCVHVEKAYADINGAFPMINREFVRHILEKYEGIRWINREEDLGLENLRRAKSSYLPAFMERKFTVRAKETL